MPDPRSSFFVSPRLRSTLFRHALLAGAIVIGLCSALSAGAQTAPTSANAPAPRHDIAIASQPLPQALAQLSQQTHLQIVYSQDEPYDVTAPAVRGRYSDAEALDQLLAGSGFTWRPLGPGAITLEKAPAAKGAVALGALNVAGATAEESRDVRGRNDVYDQDVTTSYLGKQDVERYKGVNPADVLKGIADVYSGDARNSGALDPSIRGIEGPGRVPVIIDGTEQALTVWRGYNGANNRSYIDPSLIGGLQVFKGPSMTRDVDGGIGGAVVVHTLGVDDILKPGQNFGGEVRIEGGDNSVGPRLPHLLTGQDYRNVPGGWPGQGSWPNAPYNDPTLRERLKTPGDNKALSLGDRAWRLALAGRDGDFDWLAAYAYRKRGNYFSGRHASGYYTQENLPYSSANIIKGLGLDYRPGDEVPNTSSQTDSWLLKATWHIADDQALQLNLRDTRSVYGEIMPSRIFLSGVNDIGAIQWPLSKVDAKAYNLDYKWQPGNRWLDLHANLWTTRTASHTYSAGGFPNYAPGPWAWNLPPGVDPYTIYNTGLADSQDNRVGLTLSNTMQLSDSLDLTMDGDWQYEKLSSPDPWTGYDGWRMYPRAGRRAEYDLNFHVEWRPLDAVTLDAGMRYAGYWAHDDFLADQIRQGNASQFQTIYDTNKVMGYNTLETSPQAFIDHYNPIWTQMGWSQDDIAQQDQFWQSALAGQSYSLTHLVPWYPDSHGKYRRSGDVCVNGALQNVSNYIPGSCYGTTAYDGNDGIDSYQSYSYIPTGVRTRRDHAWAPMLSVTVNFTPNSRAYARYTEFYRFPSMFESTIGFSAALNPLHPLRPEHAHVWEVAYIHDLRDLLHLDSDHRADVKLTYFHNRTDDVIERGTYLQFTNIDKQVIAGIELQARYDNGRFFTNLDASRTFTDKACDQSTAILLDPVLGRVPNCMHYGFVSSYLLTQATPDVSVNWTLGARFLDKRLETGTRAVYYRAYHNPQLDEFVGSGTIGGYGLNVPYTWGSIVTVDGYVDYRVSDRITVELAGTNLTNRYYVDPVTRSLMPAPGRAIRASLIARF